MQSERLGPYRIESELGSGGMGTVWLAEAAGRCAVPAGTRVALKVVHPHLLSEPGYFKRFLREAEIGKRVRHPNVVRCFDCDQLVAEATTHAFLVMEYVEGQTLRDLLTELETVPEELCRHIGREISKGLAAIHEAGVVHRDIKPENVLITPDHVIKIMDLGVAWLAGEAIRLSKSGAFAGSLLYASPEHFRSGGEDLDGRADLFSLGVILYELASGAHPHPGDDLASVLAQVMKGKPRRLGERNPQLSAFFEEVVHALLAKDRDERIGAASQVLRVLEQGEDGAWWDQKARAIRTETKRPLRRIRIPRETSVYGREDDLGNLRAKFERAKGGDGRVVLIEGEAGIGKSRLVDEFVGRLRRDGEDVNFLFGQYPPGGAATAAGAFSEAFREHLGEGGSAPWLSQTPVFIRPFDALLRGEPAPEDSEPLTQAALGTCFVHVTRNLAAERPTVVLIDDLHFAPAEAKALFTTLALAVPEHRIMLIGTMRSREDEKWVADLTRLEQVSQCTLARLGPKNLVALLKDAFQSERLAVELGVQIAAKSDGNPFFAFEIIRGLREGQFIAQRPDGTWASTKVVKEIQIPSSVMDLVKARVADLSEEERDLLDVACCAGFEFDPALIGEVLGIGRIPTLKRFGQIERQHRLVRASGRMMVFDHHQIQDALYGSLLVQLREEYHGGLAEALEARLQPAGSDRPGDALSVELCDHFLKAGRGESALRYLDGALTHMLQGYLNGPAVDLAERALAVPGLLEGAERGETLLRLGGADGPIDRMGLRARQEEIAREVERLAEDAADETLRGRAAMALGHVFFRTTRHEEAEAAFESALQGARRAGDRKAEAHILRILGNVFYSQGRLEEARDHGERALAASCEIGDRHAEARIAGNLGLVLFAQGRYTEAMEHHERHLACCIEIANRQEEAVASGNLGRVLLSLGRPVEAREQFERHLALSRETGERQGEAIATSNLGSVFWSQGRLAEAREKYERCIALTRETGGGRGEAIAQLNLGGVLHDEGEAELAIEQLETCAPLCEELGLVLVTAHLHLSLGSIRSAVGASASARTSLETARELAAELGLAGVETIARCELALLPGGDAGDALLAFAGNEERLSADEHRMARLLLFRATGDPAQLAEAKRGAGAQRPGHLSRLQGFSGSGDSEAISRSETGPGAPAAGSRPPG